MIDGSDVQGYQIAEGRQRFVLVRHVPFHGQVGAVKLQGQAVGYDDLVFLAQFLRQREHVILVAVVVPVAQGQATMPGDAAVMNSSSGWLAAAPATSSNWRHSRSTRSSLA